MPPASPAGIWHRTFTSLASPSFRRYFAGQAVSLTGTWMQATAQDWLVLSLSHSRTGPRMMAGASPCPAVVITPTRAPVRSSTAFVPIVVPCRTAPSW